MGSLTCTCPTTPELLQLTTCATPHPCPAEPDPTFPATAFFLTPSPGHADHLFLFPPLTSCSPNLPHFLPGPVGDSLGPGIQASVNATHKPCQLQSRLTGRGGREGEHPSLIAKAQARGGGAGSSKSSGSWAPKPLNSPASPMPSGPTQGQANLCVGHLSPSKGWAMETTSLLMQEMRLRTEGICLDTGGWREPHVPHSYPYPASTEAHTPERPE